MRIYVVLFDCDTIETVVYVVPILFQVFMRNSVFEPLEVRRFEFLTLNALFIQKIWRGFHCRKGKL